MGIPKKRKTNIQIYKGTELTQRRQELLDMVTKSDTNLPDSILHDDLDKGFLDYIVKNFRITSDGKEIPVIEKILTIQRWGEFTNNWTFSDQDSNMSLPFIAIIRKPEVQFGSHPGAQRTIPDRAQLYYASVPTWNGTQMGADIYTIPQPIPIDINFTVTIVCTKFRDLNKFNRKVMEHFASRQDYAIIKGHYIPLILDTIDDSSPIDTIEGRRFYIQNYNFTMMGYLMDSEEFEVKPAISRLFTVYEFLKGDKKITKKFVNKNVNVTVATFVADGTQTVFSVGESIGTLFNVSVNGIIQIIDQNYIHIPYTSKIEFIQTPGEPTFPLQGDVIRITYYKGRNSVILDNTGKLLMDANEIFTYTGGPAVFTTQSAINSIVSLDVNGLVEDEGRGYHITGNQEITLLGTPVPGSKIGVTYLY
jgi:hypothetical protein